jgi:hypothetical protein
MQVGPAGAIVCAARFGEVPCSGQDVVERASRIAAQVSSHM